MSEVTKKSEKPSSSSQMLLPGVTPHIGIQRLSIELWTCYECLTFQNPFCPVQCECVPYEYDVARL